MNKLLDNLSLQEEIDENAEFIPLLNKQDERIMNEQEIPEEISILPIRNTVLFPGVVIPITAGRDKSIKLLHDVYDNNRLLGVISQKDVEIKDPVIDDLNSVGTMARVIRLLKMPDGNTTVILQGMRRLTIVKFVQEVPYFKAKVKGLSEAFPNPSKEFDALIDSIRDMSLEIIRENPNIPSEAGFALKNIESPSFLVNFISSNMDLPVGEKQKLLSEDNLTIRANSTLHYLTLELQKLELKNDIRSKVQHDIDKQQREYFLHQQMRTIQEELGGHSYEQDSLDLRERAKTKKWSKEIAKAFNKELLKFQRMNAQAAEHSIQRNYLELMLNLPWNEFSEDQFDLDYAIKILDRDHFGLEDVKKRIIEYLAVLKLKNDMKSPILCLYGPPGVGKTSLGKSIAKALGRKYVRVSLGGVYDQAEVLGHRKTYIGAMPGRIIQSIKKAGTSNPVFVLDEIDKMGNNSQGDPSSAMLEVLDPEQNNEFYDNFLENGYDLSRVLFVATANYLSNIKPALRDRMEIINVSGYSPEDKVEISKRHLIPKQLKEHGLLKKHLSLGKKQIELIIESYTRESGVRGLEKKLAKVIRNIAKNIVMEQEYNPKLSNQDIIEILGPEKILRDRYEKNTKPGIATGLAWTSVGGDILFIESILTKGDGKLSMTGNLGTVMKESATIALEYIKSYHKEFGIDAELFSKTNVHIHVPEGATPKDGPSAGITMLVSLVSSYTKRRIHDKLAMTGEITLRGKVLPVGGIKEKILAAKRANIKYIILCEQNRKDVEQIKDNYLKGLTFHYVKEMSEVIDLSLVGNSQK